MSDARTSGGPLVVAAAVLWGTTGTAQALGPPGADPLAVGAVRLVVGGLALAALALVSGSVGAARRRLDGRHLPVAATIAAIAGVALYQPLFFSGVQRAGVALGTVVAIGSAPVLTGILARLVGGERLSRRWVTATAAGVVGVALVGGSGTEGGRGSGVLLALGSSFAYAVYATGSKRLIEVTTPIAAMGLAFGGGALVLAPVAAALDTSWLASAAGIAMEAWLGVATITVAYLLFGHGLARTPVSTAATLSLAEPLTAMVLGVALLGERPGIGSWLGAALIGAGLVIVAGRE